ncbi:viroplasmin family protein [Anaerostipes caccae]|uniref:ribonuclease H1 domain-containing protein n=1 Tax=Anaerostipes caccae TaxID=105841 RepID=UPI00267225CE|nr:viroplasmin family protein [Anaerostipes caccae]
MAGKKFYVVRKGKNPGIYSTWDECKKQVDGFSGAEYKSFVVIFDLTLINGTNSNRYLEAEVLDGKIDLKSFKIKKELDDTVNEVSKRFFQNNEEILERSTITNSLKFLLKTGKCI